MNKTAFSIIAGCLIPWMLHSQNLTLNNLLLQEKYQDVLSLTDSLLTQDSLNVQCFNARGTAFKAMADYPSAIQSFEKVWDLDGDIQAGLQLGSLLQESGNSTSAINVYKAIIAMDSINTRAIFALGKLQLGEGNNREAIFLFSNLYKSDSTNSLFVRSLADAYDQAKDFKMAVKYYTEAVNLNQDDRNSLFRLCNLFVKLNFIPEGIIYSSQYLQNHPKDIKFLKLNAYLTLLSFQPREAISVFQQAMVLGDSSAFLNKYMGLAYHDISAYDSSLLYLNKAKMVDAKDAEVLYFIGKCYSMLNQPDSAILYLLNTISLLNPSPTFISSIQMMIADNFNQKKRPEEALAALYEARRLDESPEVLFMLARQFDFFNEQPDSAEQYYLRFIELVQNSNDKTSTNKDLHEHTARAKERLKKIKEERFWSGLDTVQAK